MIDTKECAPQPAKLVPVRKPTTKIEQYKKWLLQFSHQPQVRLRLIALLIVFAVCLLGLVGYRFRPIVSAESEAPPAIVADDQPEEVAVKAPKAIEIPIHHQLAVNTKLSKHWPESITQWHEEIEATAAQHQIDPDLIAAIMLTESGGNPDGVSHAGAIGLMGVMPIGRQRDLFDPLTNIEAGTALLVRYLQDAGGDLFEGLAVYNGGWGNFQVYDAMAYSAQVHHDYGVALATRSETAREHHGLWTVGVALYGRDALEPHHVSQHIEWEVEEQSEHLVYHNEDKTLYVVGYAVPIVIEEPPASD